MPGLFRGDGGAQQRHLSLAALAPIAASVVLAVVNILIWYPGEANNDSDSQYRQIASGILNDWHPPAMTRLWELLLHVAPGTAPLFLLNLLLYWTTPALVAITLVRTRHQLAGWAVVAVFAIPTFIMQNINITKDVHLTVVLLFAWALIFAFRAADRAVPRGVVVMAVILISYAMLVRVNAVFAVFPMLHYALSWSRARTLVPAVLLTVVVGIMLVPAAALVNHRVLNARDAGAIRSLQLFDLGGIADRTGDLAAFGPASSIDQRMLHQCYSPMMWDTLRDCPGLMARTGRTPEDQFKRVPPLGDLWASAIVHHPGAYAAHRFASFNSATYFVEPAHHLDAVRTFSTAASRAPTLKNRVLDLVRYFPPLMPAVLLALGLGAAVLLVAEPRLRERAEPLGVMALVVSGLAYGGSFLLVGVATDLRYFLFPDLALLLGTILLLVVWGRGGDRGLTSIRSFALAIPAAAFLIVIGARTFMQVPVPADGTTPIYARSQDHG